MTLLLTTVLCLFTSYLSSRLTPFTVCYSILFFYDSKTLLISSNGKNQLKQIRAMKVICWLIELKSPRKDRLQGLIVQPYHQRPALFTFLCSVFSLVSIIPKMASLGEAKQIQKYKFYNYISPCPEKESMFLLSQTLQYCKGHIVYVVWYWPKLVQMSFLNQHTNICAQEMAHTMCFRNGLHEPTIVQRGMG